VYYTFADPREWSRDDVRSWLLWTLQQFSIPMSQVDLDLWTMDGAQFLQMGEEEFRARLPQVTAAFMGVQQFWSYFFKSAGKKFLRTCILGLVQA
jgi:hypothetical protein